MDYQSLIRSPNAAALFLLVLQETDNGKTVFRMSQADISKVIGLSRQQIRTSIQILVKSGVLKEVDNQGSNQASNQGSNQPQTFVSAYKLAVCNVLKNASNQGSNQATNQASNQGVKDEFEELWNAYGHRGSKKRAYEKWVKLTDDERTVVMKHAPLYRATELTQFVKHLDVYLNQRFWESAITTRYNVKPLSLDTKLIPEAKLKSFINWYDGEIANTRLSAAKALTEERKVMLTVDFACFKWDEIKAAIDKVVLDPYISGALPLTPGRHIPTFEEIMNPNNILKSEE